VEIFEDLVEHRGLQAKEIAEKLAGRRNRLSHPDRKLLISEEFFSNL
jgi:chorismate-pyruvate lyase